MYKLSMVNPKTGLVQLVGYFKLERAKRVAFGLKKRVAGRGYSVMPRFSLQATRANCHSGVMLF